MSPQSTNLDIQPYNDDFTPSKDYYRILFQPSVSVQTRELNQVQSIFQNQIEKFGDNIYKTGTIISGCNLSPMSPFPYIKIQDQSPDGSSISPASFINNRIINETTGLAASIVTTQDGFLVNDPDLKTLYINYNNSGYNSNVSTFTAGDTLTVFDGSIIGIEKIIITNGSTGFANTDLLV